MASKGTASKFGGRQGNAVLNQMKDTKNEKELTNMMADLKKTTSNRKAVKRFAKNRDTILTLKGSLDTHPKFTKMVEYSLDCIKNLAVDTVSVEEMLEEGVLDSLLNVMKLNPYNETIQQLINKTLQALCKNEEIAKQIGEKLGGEGFVFSMKKHVDPTTLVSTCNTVAMLAQNNPENVDRFANAGMIPAAANLIKNNSENDDVLASATEVLNQIAGHRDYAVQIMNTGVIEHVLKAVGNHADNAKLVKASLALMAKMAAAGPEFVERMKGMGAVDTLVNLLEQYGDDEEVLKLGAQALALLADSDDISRAMIATGNNLATANALAKIASLMLVEDNVDYMIQNNGIEWLIAAMKSALGDNSPIAQKILDSGCKALMRMATDEHKIYAIMQKGGVKLLVAVAQQHVKDEKVVSSALQALTKMVTRKENAQFLAKNGAINAAIGAYHEHPDNEKVAKTALDFLSKMAQHDVVVPALVQAGAIKDVVDILQRHGENPEMAMTAVNTLGRLATSAENVKLIADAGGLEALVKTLREHPEDANLAKATMLLLETAAMVPANVEKLRAAGAMDAILKALDAHPEDAELQKIGASALARIAGEQELQKAVTHMNELSADVKKSPQGGVVKALVDKYTNNLNLLSNLALVEQNKTFLGKNGGVRALINAFEAAGQLPPGVKRGRVQATAVQGLCRLADQPDAAQIIQGNTLHSIVQAALDNPECEELAQAAMALMAKLAANPAYLSKLQTKEAIADIVALAQAFHMDEKVLASAVRALALIGSDPNKLQDIIRGGGAAVVVESVYSNMDDPNALLNALQMISQLAVDEAAIQALLAAGAIDAILEAMRKYPANADIIGACVQALCRLLVNESVAVEIGSKGGNPLLVKAMRDHYQNEGICEIDMILLDSMASVPDNATKLLEPDLRTVELVKWIVEAYPQNKPLEEAAARLLAILCPPKEPEIKVLDGDVKLDAQQADDLIAQLKNGELNAKQLAALCTSMRNMGRIPANAALMVKRGGLQALAGVMNANKNNEAVFLAAASAFATLVENGGDEALALLEEAALMEAMCEMMKPHPEFANQMDLNDLTKAIAAMAKMKLKPELIHEMLKNSPLDALMKIFCESDDPLLLAQAARLLGKLSNDEDAVQLLAKIANLRELIAAMRRNIKNQEFLKYGVYLLANLALSDELKNEIGIEGGIQLILQIMDLYPQNAGLIENCCYALAQLSFENDINCSFVVACKGIQHLIAAMQNHAKLEDMLESAVCVLCNLCHNNDVNKDLIIKQGGAPAIVEVVLNNFNSMDLLLTSFRALGNLAYSRDNISNIIKSGGVQAIVAGMTVHNEALDLIDIAIRVLTNLASDLDEENQAIMAQEGAVQAIVDVADKYASNLDMEMSALRCLSSLARQNYNAVMILKQSGVEATLKATRELAFDAELNAVAMGLFQDLSLCVQEIDRMHEAHAPQGIVACFKQHPGEPRVVIGGAIALRNMAYNEEVAGKMAAAGPIPQLIGFLKKYESDPNVLAACYQGLSGLCRHEENANTMAASTLNSLSAQLPKVGNNAHFLNHAMAYVANLCIHSGAAEVVKDTNMVKATTNALKLHKADPGTIIRGMRALENMAYCKNPEVRNHMKDQGVIEACEEQIAATSRDDVKAACQAVINAVNRKDINTTSPAFMSLKQPATTNKNAKSLFGDDLDKKVPELDKATRNFLTAGALLMKHSNNAKPRPRHCYVSTDLKWLYWKDPHKPVSDKVRMKVLKIRSVERGRCTPQLQRKTAFGKFLAKEECSFAILGRERSIDLETKLESERERWVECLEILMAYNKQLKAKGQKFGEESDW